MKTNDWIRILIWGVLLIACLLFGIIGLTKHKRDTRTPEYRFNEIDYTE